MTFTSFTFVTKPAAVMAALAVAGCTVTPQPLTVTQLNAIADDRAARAIGPGQEPVTQSIDLYEAMARAIKYNLDHQVELKQEALKLSELRLSESDMLPDLVANAAYTDRDNTPGASSQSILSGNQSLEPSRSTDRDVLNSDLTLSWDVLDFGLSYVRAKQNADKVLIATEQRRSAINRIIEDVRTAYWRAVIAQRLLGRLKTLEASAQRSLAQAERQAGDRSGAPRDAMIYQRDLLTVMRAAQELRRDLGVAKNQLAALMNLPQNQPFKLAVPASHNQKVPLVRTSSEELAKMAFRNRPELREITYRMRINEQEKDIGLLEALPSLKAFIGVNTSSNDFLYNQDWVSYGAKASWNLMRLPTYPRRLKTNEAGQKLLDARALALTQAIATQVFVSKARVVSLRGEYATAQKLARVNTQIARQTVSEAESGALGPRDVVTEQMNAILADLRRDVTYADLQNAYA
ncbi:hypothetical protein BFP70_19865, partial [Thioclava sp. SK-1]|uniref:TolC family protein n=1 Tax=Thioclava sp. SK-1 TaxID=1889770 RepID=UPI00082459F0